jgi:predicted DNA-binding transcriptional regulator
MRDQLAKELENIGLSEKEAKVYLAALELGPSTAQSIAAKATVNRSNTYVMIESLIKRGLMSSFEKGKKRYFESERPDRLIKVIDEDIRGLQKKKDLFVTLLPGLNELVAGASSSTRVRIFEDLNGLVQLQEDMLQIASSTKIVYAIAAVDDARKFVSADSMTPLWEKLRRNKVQVKSIYTKEGEAQDVVNPLWENRRLPIDRFPFRGELVIYGDKASFVTYDNGKIVGTLIESSSINSLLKTLFDLAWEQAANQTK